MATKRLSELRPKRKAVLFRWLVKGYNLALRKEEASNIQVEVI